MTEAMVKDELDFLVKKYGLHYEHQTFENYYGSCPMRIYSYHNEDGCFAIAYLSYGDEITYLRYDSINLLKGSHYSEYLGGYNTNNEADMKEYRNFIDEKLSHVIRITEYEPEIWKKHRVKLFLSGYKGELRVLAEVIETQIQKTGQFFGIKV